MTNIFKNKYLKYKLKYLNLKNKLSGGMKGRTSSRSKKPSRKVQENQAGQEEDAELNKEILNLGEVLLNDEMLNNDEMLKDFDKQIQKEEKDKKSILDWGYERLEEMMEALRRSIQRRRET